MGNSKLTYPVTKVCYDPGCEAVWHNCPKNETRCKDCGGLTIEINQKTFENKFADNFVQYDFQTYEYYRPKRKFEQLRMAI